MLKHLRDKIYEFTVGYAFSPQDLMKTLSKLEWRPLVKYASPPQKCMRCETGYSSFVTFRTAVPISIFYAFLTTVIKTTLDYNLLTFFDKPHVIFLGVKVKHNRSVPHLFNA